jgi:hypothetical protein
MNLTCTVDTRKLNLGIAVAMDYTKRTLAEKCNSVAYFVARGAYERTPFVAVERINQELAVKGNPVMGRSGKALKGKFTYASLRTVSTKNRDVPLAALIINKMVKQGGRSLGKGFNLAQSPFKGLPRALGAQKMAAFIDKLIKKRRSSTHFLASGWIPAMKIFDKYAKKNESRSATPDLGTGKPAVEGVTVSAMIENDVGARGPVAASSNKALLTYGTPALQSSIDAEGTSQMNHALKAMEMELSGKTNAHWK